MRRLIICAALLAVSGVTPVHAAETGAIKGRVVHADTDKPKSEVEVTLTIGNGAGELDTATTTTDAKGRYRFDDLATGEEHFYALDASYDGGLFAGRPIVIPSDTAEPPVIASTLRVWDTTTDPAAILIRRNDVFVVQDGDGVGLIESFRIVNPTHLAYIGRGGDDGEAGSTPTVGFWLPERADKQSVQILESDIDVPALLPTEYGFATTMAVPPGETHLTYTYRVNGTAANFDLTRTALYATAEVDFYAEPPLTIESNRLESKGSVEVGDKTYTRFATTEGLDPADPVQVLATAEAGTRGGLLLGVVAVLLLLVAAAMVGWRRSRPPSVARPAPLAREELLASIAELDLRYEAGEISDEEHAARRSAMKEDLRKRSPEAAR
jgi:carboxypeptidase family protein